MLLSSLLSSRLRDVWPLWRLKIQDRRLQTERRRVTKRIGISSRSFQEALAEMPIVHSSFSSACCLTAGPTTRLRPHGLGQGTAAWGKRQHLTSASYCFLWGVRYSSETFLHLAGFAKDCWFGWFKGGQLRKICWPDEAGSQMCCLQDGSSITAHLPLTLTRPPQNPGHSQKLSTFSLEKRHRQRLLGAGLASPHRHPNSAHV